MTQPGQVPRTLVVVNNDYGELLLAMMFLQGQRLAGNAALLLPPRLHAANAAALDLAVYPFTNLDDILSVADEWRPQVVILMSGYLFSNNKLLSRHDLRRLVAHVRAAGGDLLTTDPFLGLAGTLTPGDIRLGLPESSGPGDDTLLLPSSDTERQNPAARIDRRTIQESMRNAEREIGDDLSEVSQILSEVTHLYGVPASRLPDNVERVSFFNPELERQLPGGRLGAIAPCWLFIIGSHDLWYQQLHGGVDTFAQLLGARLTQAAHLGAQPSVIAPPALLDQLSAMLPPGTAVELTRFCPHDDYVRRLLDAEYVFYWNLFSASFMLRLSCAKPSFFFDRGHLSRLIERAYPAGLRVLLSGWEPAYLTLSEALDPAELEADAASQTRRFREMVDDWRQSPTPDELVSERLARRPL